MVRRDLAARDVSKTDPYLGTQEIYTQQVEAPCRISRFDYGAHPAADQSDLSGLRRGGALLSAHHQGAVPRARSPRPDPEPAPAHRWEGVAIVGGMLAFLLAGLLLRKGRQLDTAGAMTDRALRRGRRRCARGHRRHLGGHSRLFEPAMPRRSRTAACDPSPRRQARRCPSDARRSSSHAGLAAGDVQDPGPAARVLARGSRRASRRPIAHWHGKSLVINFWATWCAPCRREIPLLEALPREWAERGMAVVGIAVDQRDQVLAAMRTN